MADSKRNKNRCSFCGRTEDEVGFLITGMNGYICDSCATQAYEITQEALGGAKRSGAATKLNLRELPKPLEIKEFLDQYVIGQDDAKRFLFQFLNFTCRDFNIRGLSLCTTHRLMYHYTRVSQRRALAFGACHQQHCSHTCRHTCTDSSHITRDKLHCIIDAQSRIYGATWN